MTNALSREEKAVEKKGVFTLIEGEDQRYQQAQEALSQYKIGEFITELNSMAAEIKPRKVVIALYGLVGTGKSTLINYLKRVVVNGKYIEGSPVASASRPGPSLLLCWNLTHNSIIYDTRGLDGLNNEKQISEAVSEIVLQVSGKKKPGYVERGSSEEEELSLARFECALETEPERIHLPILCAPSNADSAQKRGLSQIIQKLTRLNIFPVLAITKYDLVSKDEKWYDKSEKEFARVFAEEVGLSKDDVFIFKAYCSEDDERDVVGETKALENLHKMFGKAERNMRFKPLEHAPMRLEVQSTLMFFLKCCLMFTVLVVLSFYIAALLFRS